MHIQRPGPREDGGNWILIPDGEVAAWNDQLRSSPAHLYQYPVWNEPLRKVGLTPRYARFEQDGIDIGFVCILGLHLPGFRIGVVRCGPVNLGGNEPLPRGVLTALAEYAMEEGYVCLRVSTQETLVRESFADKFGIADEDPLPPLAHYDHEMVVLRADTDAAQLAGFKKNLRYEIRKADRAGFLFERCSSGEDLEGLWQLTMAMDRRKGQKVYARPQSSYVDLARAAYAHGIGDLFKVSADGVPVQFLLVVRDRDAAHYALGALDLSSLGGRPSPAGWAQWEAMRRSFEKGVNLYNLGNQGDQNLRVFKAKFNPERQQFLPVFTAVLRPGRYLIWRKLFPFAMRLRGWIRHLPV